MSALLTSIPIQTFRNDINITSFDIKSFILAYNGKNEDSSLIAEYLYWGYIRGQNVTDQKLLIEDFLLPMTNFFLERFDHLKHLPLWLPDILETNSYELSDFPATIFENLLKLTSSNKPIVSSNDKLVEILWERRAETNLIDELELQNIVPIEEKDDDTTPVIKLTIDHDPIFKFFFSFFQRAGYDKNTSLHYSYELKHTFASSLRIFTLQQLESEFNYIISCIHRKYFEFDSPLFKPKFLRHLQNALRCKYNEPIPQDEIRALAPDMYKRFTNKYLVEPSTKQQQQFYSHVSYALHNCVHKSQLEQRTHHLCQDIQRLLGITNLAQLQLQNFEYVIQIATNTTLIRETPTNLLYLKAALDSKSTHNLMQIQDENESFHPQQNSVFLK